MDPPKELQIGIEKRNTFELRITAETVPCFLLSPLLTPDWPKAMERSSGREQRAVTSPISMGSSQLSWESIHCLMSAETCSLGRSADKWKTQRRLLLREVMCKQERSPSKAEGSVLHIHPFNWCFGLFYQQCGNKLVLIKAADCPKTEGAETSRKAGPWLQLSPGKRSARLHVQHEERSPRRAGQVLPAPHWNQKGQCHSCTSPMLYSCFRLSLRLTCLLRTEWVRRPKRS